MLVVAVVLGKVLLVMEEKEDQVLRTHLVVMVVLQVRLEIMVVVLPMFHNMDRDRMAKWLLEVVVEVE